MKATFYGVSVGPGDPELLTIKAVNAIKNCPVIAAPQTKGEKTLALDIARSAVDLTDKIILPLHFLMSKDPLALQAQHAQSAKLVMEHLAAGRNVAMLNLGDVSIYSTFSYIAQLIEQAGWPVEIIPGVPSFCAVAAKLHTSLTTMQQPLHIIPASHGNLEEALALPGTRVLMKSGRAMPKVKKALKQANLYEKASLVYNCGLPDEKVCKKLEDSEEQMGYFTTIVVK